MFGHRIVKYLAQNVDNLKKRGAADVQLGFWLAPLEDIDWVDMKDKRGQGNTKAIFLVVQSFVAYLLCRKCEKTKF